MPLIVMVAAVGILAIGILIGLVSGFRLGWRLNERCKSERVVYVCSTVGYVDGMVPSQASHVLRLNKVQVRKLLR